MGKDISCKSTDYPGIYQRTDGTWFYRAKRIVDGKEVYYQKGGFETDKIAYEARENRLRLEKYKTSSTGATQKVSFSFEEVFQDFLDNCESDSSKKKYHALYTAQLSCWSEKDVSKISNSDIELLLLSLTLQGKSDSYIASIRKVIKKFFQFAYKKGYVFSAETGQFLSTKPIKLKVLSLFSGIGAPEQALKELQEEIRFDFELVNYCEFDDKASYAYSLLHGIDLDKDLTDIELIDFDYCRRQLPDFDLMVFGSPCQDLSSSGKRDGFAEDGIHPDAKQLFYDYVSYKPKPKKKGEIRPSGTLTRSGLLYRALQIALWKKPKFMIAENVAPLIGKGFREDFHSILCNLQDAGYNIYYKKYNSRWFNVPQSRPRAFLIMIRDDLNMHFQLPKPVFTSEELRKGEVNPIKAEEWFEKEVADEYYISQPEKAKIAFEEKTAYHPNFQRDYISCLTTGCGEVSHAGRKTLIEDSKGIRCLTSEELMRFQGFPPEYGTILREHGYTKQEIGELVGNSMTVPVIKAMLKSLLQSIIDYKPITGGVVPTMQIEAQIDEEYIKPLIPYTGNKSKLLPYLRYRFPSQVALQNMTFVDLFAGSAFMAINTPAERVVINEINPFLIGIYKGLCATPPEDAWKLVMEIVEQYGLSTDNKENFYKCRTDYNKIPYEERVNKFWYWGLALLYHSYNGSDTKHNKEKSYMCSYGGEHCNFNNSKSRFFPFATKLYESNLNP